MISHLSPRVQSTGLISIVGIRYSEVPSVSLCLFLREDQGFFTTFRPLLSFKHWLTITGWWGGTPTLSNTPQYPKLCRSVQIPVPTHLLWSSVLVRTFPWSTPRSTVTYPWGTGLLDPLGRRGVTLTPVLDCRCKVQGVVLLSIRKDVGWGTPTSSLTFTRTHVDVSLRKSTLPYLKKFWNDI